MATQSKDTIALPRRKHLLTYTTSQFLRSVLWTHRVFLFLEDDHVTVTVLTVSHSTKLQLIREASGRLIAVCNEILTATCHLYLISANQQFLLFSQQTIMRFKSFPHVFTKDVIEFTSYVLFLTFIESFAS